KDSCTIIALHSENGMWSMTAVKSDQRGSSVVKSDRIIFDQTFNMVRGQLQEIGVDSYNPKFLDALGHYLQLRGLPSRLPDQVFAEAGVSIPPAVDPMAMGRVEGKNISWQPGQKAVSTQRWLAQFVQEFERGAYLRAFRLASQSTVSDATTKVEYRSIVLKAS